MSATGYANGNGRIELETSESGAVQRACRHCGNPLADHDRERVTPDDGRGPDGAYHYRYVCPDGFVPDLAGRNGGGL